MNSFSMKLLAGIILVVICLFSILPTVRAATIVLDQEKKENNIEIKEEANKVDESEDNTEKNMSFQVMMADILSTSENLNINNVGTNIPNEKGIWIDENSREYVLNLINTLTNKTYNINNYGFLTKEDTNKKNNQENKEIHEFYTNKVNELMSSNKLIIISINDTYKQFNDIDKDIIDIEVDENDYALLFKENLTDENANEIIILNSKKYNDKNSENTTALLMNKILEIYYYDNEEFIEFQKNTEFIDNSGTYEVSISKQENSNGKNELDNLEQEEILNSDNSIKLDEKEELIDVDEDIIVENKEELEKNTNEKDNMFEDSISKDRFDIIVLGILSNNINLEDKESILLNKPNDNGIWISPNSRQKFLDFLNIHTVYTYLVDSRGYLICDNQMKDNTNLDLVEKVETEIDIEIKNILSQDILIMIDLDNKYLEYDENQNVEYKELENVDYVKTFSYNNERIVILNNIFYENVNYNLALSDYFVKSLENIQEKVLLGELTFNKQPMTRSDVDKPGKMLSAQTVYAGPSNSDYATVGSVSNGELVYILGQEAGWYHIQYIVTGKNQQKSGFVPVSTVDNNGYYIHEEQMVGGQNFAKKQVNILSCDDFDIAVSLGSVFEGEGLTELYGYQYTDANKSYGVAYVEISTSTGTKRGYMYLSDLTGVNYPSSVARVTETNTAYAGPDSSYVKLGGSYLNEYVTIIAKDTGNDWVWVEYNTTSGRKRGFMSYSKLSNYNHPGSYNDLPINNGIRSATKALDVYGGPNTSSAKIGSIGNQEIVSIYNTERGYAYIEYTTSSGAKRGYVPEDYLINANAPSIPNINAYNFQSGTYGRSGKGTDLKYYKLGSGKNTMFAIFGQHGWEDAWAFDGVELINIAQRVIQDLSSTGISNNWTLYIIPYANPDGITNGYTNGGPGRCTVTTSIDMNRCWPSNFQPVYTSRNYTGASPLGAPEAVQLKTFIENNIGSEEKIIVDIHGWLNKTYGDIQIGKYFDNQFGFTHNSSYGSGYLQAWGKSIGAKSCLLEYPMPTSTTSIISNDYSGKTSTAIRNMLNDIGVPMDEGGEEVNEQVKVISDGNLNVRQGPGTTYDKIATLPSSTIVTRIKRNVTTANGYVWDKIKLSDGRIGYVATNYLELYVIDYYSDGTYTYQITKDGGTSLKIKVDPNAEANYREQEQLAGATEITPINKIIAADTKFEAERLALELYILGAKDAGNNLMYFVSYGEKNFSDRMGEVHKYINEEEGFTEGHVKKEIFFNEAIRDLSGAKETLYTAANALMGAAEKMLENNTSGTYEIQCLNEITGNTGNINVNWFGAINNYRTQNKATITVQGNKYTMELQHNILDYYDYQNYEGIYLLFPGFAFLDNLSMLNELGIARNYTTYDELTYTVSWEKGQRINYGATISGPGL